MRNSQFADRCVAAGLLLALVGLFGAMAFAMIDNEPRATRTTLILHR